jgi:osmoprotectant transport system substrate-binding protein
VALLFTTDPAIRARHLVVLADDRDLQPAENIVPVLRRATVHRFGPGLLAALNALSARLSGAALADLNAQMGPDGRAPRVVAERWARAQGLTGPGQGAP